MSIFNRSILRFYFMVNGMASSFKVTDQDINYVALPLYHSNGGVGGIGMMIYKGTSVVIAKKFSASKFFQDCSYHGATVCKFQIKWHSSVLVGNPLKI